MEFLSTLGNKREKRDRKATSHLYLLTRSSTDPIRFLVCKEQEQQEQQQKQTRRDKEKGSISRNSLGPFQTRSQKHAGQFVRASGYFLRSRRLFWKMEIR
jgi:hypothetical protein